MGATDPLRLKKIELHLQVAQTLAQLQARSHVAVLAVALTLAGSLAFAASAGQVSWSLAGPMESGMVVVAATQVRALRQTARQLREETLLAMADIDKLMDAGGEQDVDADPRPGEPRPTDETA